MLIAMALAASLMAYAFIGGAVHRTLLRTDHELTADIEDAAAMLWPLLPVAGAALLVYLALERTLSWAIDAGHAAADLPGRLSRWMHERRRPRLHSDCLGTPLGPCESCERELARGAARTLPQVRTVVQ